MELNTAVTTIAVPILATIAAVASAIAAWKSQIAATQALEFQKKLTRHQDDLILLRSTKETLFQLRRVLVNPWEASDEDFLAMESTHSVVKRNLESLYQSGALIGELPAFFQVQGRAQIVDLIPHSLPAIDQEIRKLQGKIDEIFA
ncbi:hypothetical protein FSY45_22550 [Comamonas sp. Z1]|uniref:hypothetical protein n=1 Tax=Comamonas TaxID=283 RepID=UPI0006210ACD|nr:MULTISPECIES: hypothetical protein [Comamonas]KKI12331.1 hypothetical protein XA67_20110 [Comamonas thiooxydans]TYK72104.1 hypothetical protein FSY45_22550 [Comamonas sp. Z1]BCX53881.1 hypothetical protein CTYAZ2_34610 [Comamonas testosteroni]